MKYQFDSLQESVAFCVNAGLDPMQCIQVSYGDTEVKGYYVEIGIDPSCGDDLTVTD